MCFIQLYVKMLGTANFVFHHTITNTGDQNVPYAGLEFFRLLTVGVYNECLVRFTNGSSSPSTREAIMDSKCKVSVKNSSNISEL